MQRPHYLDHCRAMLAQALHHGAIPIVFIMNGEVRKQCFSIAADEREETLGFLGRRWFHWRRRSQQLLALFGVPVIENNFLPESFISLQLAPVPGQFQPNLSTGAQQQSQQNAAPDKAFWQKGGSPQPAANPDTPTLSDLSSSDAERPTVSDVLIRAMEGADSLKGVAVVRIYRNGDVDLCANVNKFELQGVLQHAQMWVMQNGD